MRNILKKSICILKQYGFITLINRLINALPSRINKIQRIIISVFKYKQIEKEISVILNSNNYSIIDIQYFSFGWEVTLFQRPQHLARYLSQNGVLVLYGMHSSEYKSGNYPIYKLESNLYMVDLDNPIVFRIIEQKVKNINTTKYFHVYSTNANYSFANLTKLSKYFNILYEYIDSIKLSKDIQIRHRHEKILKMNDIKVVVTAKELFDEVSRFSHCSYIKISNGVDYNHWNNYKHKPISILEKIHKDEKIVIGYYGALTKDWFDFQLIEKLVKLNSLHIVLIGPLNYMGPSNESSNEYYKKLKTQRNVTLLDAVSYEDLPNYAKYFDIAIIPFLVNEITEATSPVKLFEYMASGKPIITTNLPECKQYSVVKVTTTHEEFIKEIIKLRDNPVDSTFINELKNESKRNTWSQKAVQMKNFMLENDSFKLSK